MVIRQQRAHAGRRPAPSRPDGARLGFQPAWTRIFEPSRSWTGSLRFSDGRQIRGRYTIPAGVHDFPLSLVGEAVGQLAAWAAMAAVDFAQRPVAGLAGSIELLQAPRPGQVLELAADLEHVDAESVAYCGTAHVDGTPVIRLQDCVGPMVPLADFDDPQALRTRFDELCRSRRGAGGFPGLPALTLERDRRRDRAMRVAPASRCPPRRLSSPITFPAARCFRAACSCT